MISNKRIVEIIKNSKKIAIFGHKLPDPDACGSAFGLREFCRELGVKADVSIANPLSSALSKIFPKDFKVEPKFRGYDLVVLVDGHSLDRVEDVFIQQIQNAKKMLIIDHHQMGLNEKLVTEDALIDTDSASASQLILNLYRQAKLTPSSTASTYLYAGLIGDTSRFLNTNVNHDVFVDATYLFDCGANLKLVYDALYRNVNKKFLKLSSYIYSHLNYLENGEAVFIAVSQKDMKRLGVEMEDVKNFSNELKKLENVEISMLVYECKKGIYKFSIRESGKYPVFEYVKRQGGGGHVNACGFDVKSSKRNVIKHVKKMLAEIKNA